MRIVENKEVSYQPFYCEENVWHLAQRTDLVTGPSQVVLIVGPAAGSRVACWYQRAADPGEAVLWDYHVVLAEQRADSAEGPKGPETFIWDLDTRLPCPCPAALWLAATFQDTTRVLPRYHPRFRVVASDVYVRELATDRSHMRDAHGRWRRPPPPWDPPGAPAMNLASWTNASPDGPGAVYDRAALEASWGCSVSAPARRPGSA